MCIGHLLDTAGRDLRKCLILLALPRGDCGQFQKSLQFRTKSPHLPAEGYHRGVPPTIDRCGREETAGDQLTYCNNLTSGQPTDVLCTQLLYSLLSKLRRVIRVCGTKFSWTAFKFEFGTRVPLVCVPHRSGPYDNQDCQSARRDSCARRVSPRS